MTVIHRPVTALAIAAVGALTLAGVYAEAHRAPDQS
jgi:hypothetical protein